MRENQEGRLLGSYVPDYVVFDLETTGISPARDRVVEISAVKVRGGKVVDSFTTLVNPGMHISEGASRVNGITDEMVADAPDFSVALADFLRFAGGDVLVGHNIVRFDLKFLRRDMEHYFGRPLPNDYIDTLPLSREVLPGLAHHRLVDLASYYQISTRGAHRALADSLMNQQVYEALSAQRKK